MHYVYLLRCADSSLYVGETANLQIREQHHNEGRGGSYTAKRRPVRMVYAERHNSKQEALKRERQIKRWNLQKKGAARKWRPCGSIRCQPEGARPNRIHVERLAGPANRITATSVRSCLTLEAVS